MPIPIRQNLLMAAYLTRQRLAKPEKYPLIVELEPLFACNLACPGCGKIQYPTEILRKRPSEAAFAAVEECGAPMVSIAGGEPLAPPADRGDGRGSHQRASGSSTSARMRYSWSGRIDRFKPSPYFSWVVHIDGLKERHDEAVDRDGSLRRGGRGDQARQVEGLPRHDELDVLHHGLRQDDPRGPRLPERRARSRRDDDLAGLRVREGARPGALPRGRSGPGDVPRGLRGGRRKRWRLNHTPLFLDFLEGKVDYQCTPGGFPATRSSAGSDRAI